MLKNHNIEALEWPAKPPDLNPIENIWSILKSSVYRRNPKTTDELRDYIFEEWETLDNEMVGEVAGSFNKRLNK